MRSLIFVFLVSFCPFLRVCAGLFRHPDVCENKEAFQCESRLYHQLEFNSELDPHRFCSYLAALQSCLLHEAKCDKTNTTKAVQAVKNGISVACTSLGDEKTELSNGCRDPAYTTCIHEDKTNFAHAGQEEKLAQDYVCELTKKTNECLKTKAFCNQNFRDYREQLAEHRFGLTCSASTSTISIISAILLISAISRVII